MPNGNLSWDMADAKNTDWLEITLYFTFIYYLLGQVILERGLANFFFLVKGQTVF